MRRPIVIGLGLFVLLALCAGLGVFTITSQARQLAVVAQEPVQISGSLVITNVEESGEPISDVQPINPTPTQDALMRMGSVASKIEGPLAHVTGNAQVYSKTASARYFWVVVATNRDNGHKESMSFHDDIISFPNNETQMNLHFDKVFPFDSGRYRLLVKLQAVPQTVTVDKLIDDPDLSEQCGMITGESRFEVP